MVNTSITLSLRLILVAIDANENHKAGEELWGAESPQDVLNSYSFVGWVKRRLIE
jgi:hypothetical protein